ncbi:MAG TPA: hypothetical protein VF070_37720 [Streptosporangiaceae bacterium]
MNSVEDEIRKALRSEARELREVRPLRLPPADVPHRRTRPHGRTVLRAWQGPVAAAAAVLLVAVALVTLKSIRNEHAAPPAGSAPAASSALPAVPRYYVRTGWERDGKITQGVNVGDALTGKTIATIPFAKGTSAASAAPAGAADDRTFVVATTGPVALYMLRIYPGSADPVRMTRLPIQSAPDQPTDAMALSGDESKLAVVSGNNPPYTLRVYSMASGRLQHAWSAPARAGVSNLNWVGDSIVGFDAIYTPNIREDSVKAQEVRTLDINAPGTDLFADSHVVWSHDGPRPELEVTPGACYTPFLSGNGQTVVCASFTRSGPDQRLSAEWLAYAVMTPTKPRILASIPMPKDVSGVNPESVEWTNASGTQVIGTWSSTVTTGSGKKAVSTTTNFIGLIEGGTVTRFPFMPSYDEGW